MKNISGGENVLIIKVIFFNSVRPQVKEVSGKIRNKIIIDAKTI